MGATIAAVVVSAAIMTAVPALADGLGPGDWGYRHMEYHSRGIVDEVETRSGRTCCDDMGECRATYVNLKARTAYLNGKWCPLYQAAIRYDVSLPDEMAMICAGRFLDPITRCPVVYCGAVPSGM